VKRTLVASAIAITLGTIPTVKAGTAGLTGVWKGLYTWGAFSPGGGSEFIDSIPQAWTFDFAAGTVALTNTHTFYGSVWTAHDITFTDNGDGTYSGALLWDWSTSINDTVLLDWDISDTGVVSSSGPVTADSSAFPGQWRQYNGTISQVPIPAAVWLYVSGLLGLVGISRRKNTG
jgi:hypothetical protein